MFDLVLKNGLIITPRSSTIADIGIKDGKIQVIDTKGINEDAKRTIDLSGKLVMAGIIDPHNHISARFRGIIDELDFFTASKIAAFGGVTTFMDFSESAHGASVLREVKKRIKSMEESSIDFSLHAKIIQTNSNILKEIKDLIEFGVPTMKLFMTYRKAGVMVSDPDILKVMEVCKRYGGRPGFHAESNVILEYNDQKFEEAGTMDWEHFALAKPNVCELEAVNRIIAYSEFMDCPIYIFHLTTKEGKKAIELAQKRGLKVYTETCPHYLTLTDEVYKKEDGHLYLMSPPLRKVEDQDELWKGLIDGTISIIGSDNCTFTKETKEVNLERDEDGNIIPNYLNVINGVSGIEERLALLISGGINKGRINWNKLTEITSENPAKIFGMYPQKGIIAVGSDADFVIIDPEKENIISAETLHYGLDYCIYDGIKSKGWPIMTISKGEVIVENGEFKGKKGAGKFISRKLN